MGANLGRHANLIWGLWGTVNHLCPVVLLQAEFSPFIG